MSTIIDLNNRLLALMQSNALTEDQSSYLMQKRLDAARYPYAVKVGFARAEALILKTELEELVAQDLDVGMGMRLDGDDAEVVQWALERLKRLLEVLDYQPRKQDTDTR